MKKGDFIKIDFVGRVVATGEIFDLTSEDVAKKEGIYNQKHKYGPVLVIVGSDMVIPGVEKELLKMKMGEEKEFVVKADEAFGFRDLKLIKILSLSKFIEKKINPVPGFFVEIDGRQAKIQSVSGGRVRVDFNHPLAGKELKYKLKIVSFIKKSLEKAKALLNYYNMPVDIKLEKSTLILKMKKKVEKPELIKKFIDKTIRKHIKEIKKIRFKKF